MSRRLDHMFDGADGVLLSMSEGSRNSTDQRRYFDTRQVIRQHRAALTRAVQAEIAGAFLPGAEGRRRPETADVSFDELQLAKTRAIEESIAVNNIATRVENQNEKALFDLTRRLEYLVHEQGAATSPQALAPATLCNAFRIGTQSLQLDFQLELVVYKIFDQLVAGALGEVYAEALALLERRGLTAMIVKGYRPPGAAPRPAVTARPPAPGPTAPPAAGGPVPSQGLTGALTAAGASFGATGAMPTPGGAAAPAAGPSRSMPALDPRTLDSLRSRYPATFNAANYGDAELATELAQLAGGQGVAGWGPPQARANLQCADLVGRMFNGIVEDAALPTSLKSQIDELRFTVIKSALADRSFFDTADHPIRRLVHELATMAATARATGRGSIGQLASLVAAIQSQFQVAAHAARNAAAHAVPLADAEAERFLDDQQVQARARRQALIDRARRIVREELELRMKGRVIAAEAQPMLLSGLSPLLGLRLLRKGMDSDAWREGIELLERALEALDAARPQTDAVEIDGLRARIDGDLQAAGMAPARATELGAALRQGLQAAQHLRQTAPPAAPAAAPEPPAAVPTDLLLRLLVPGDWFKVHDADRQQTRWLKFTAHHLDDSRPEYRGRVAFAEFSGQNTLLVKVEDLLDHIAAGLTEPFDQSPAARATLADLVQRQQARLAQSADFPT